MYEEVESEEDGMSPIVYVPPKKHVCEPPRQGDRVESPSKEDWYPERSIWECEKCAQWWELTYDLHRTWSTGSWRRRSYSYFYYEVNWRRVYY